MSSIDEIKQAKIETNFTNEELDVSLSKSGSTLPGGQTFKMAKEKEQEFIQQMKFA